jgi:hypothetical protein
MQQRCALLAVGRADRAIYYLLSDLQPKGRLE